MELVESCDKELSSIQLINSYGKENLIKCDIKWDFDNKKYEINGFKTNINLKRNVQKQNKELDNFENE